MRRTDFFLCLVLAVSFDILPNYSMRGESKQQLCYSLCSIGLLYLRSLFSFQLEGPVYQKALRLFGIQKVAELTWKTFTWISLNSKNPKKEVCCMLVTETWFSMVEYKSSNDFLNATGTHHFTFTNFTRLSQ